MKGTVFNDFHNEEKIIKTINFDDFEEQFKLGIKPGGKLMMGGQGAGGVNGNGAGPGSTGTLNASKRYNKSTEKVSLLEHNRLRNMSISMRKIDIETEAVVRAINALDTSLLTLDYTEVLLRMIPQPEEIKAYREYERAGRPLEEMSDVDKFLLQISKVERLEPKLRIMFYMNNVTVPVESSPVHGPKGGSQSAEVTNITQYRQRILAIGEAAKSIRKSPGVRTMLEYILVLGNYLNCSTRTLATAPAYGFKLQTLDLITETKSSNDRSRSMLHYLVDVILSAEGSSSNGGSSSNKTAGLMVAAAAIRPLLSASRSSHALSGDSMLDSVKMPFDFEKLLATIETATYVSLETCALEVIEIEKGMELCKNELAQRNSSGLSNNPATKSLAAFINTKGPEVRELREELRKAQQQYNECVEYFGENPKMMESSNQLFGAFVRFLKNFKQCQVDNILAQKKKFEEELRQQILEKQQQRMNAANGGGSSAGGAGAGDKDSNEMKVKEKRLLKQDEVYNGALEDILLGNVDEEEEDDYTDNNNAFCDNKKSVFRNL